MAAEVNGQSAALSGEKELVFAAVGFRSIAEQTDGAAAGGVVGRRDGLGEGCVLRHRFANRERGDRVGELRRMRGQRPEKRQYGEAQNEDEQELQMFHML